MDPREAVAVEPEKMRRDGDPRREVEVVFSIAALAGINYS
jgi:hypothetical protein